MQFVTSLCSVASIRSSLRSKWQYFCSEHEGKGTTRSPFALIYWTQYHSLVAHAEMAFCHMHLPSLCPGVIGMAGSLSGF